jgi:hypothetical protein
MEKFISLLNISNLLILGIELGVSTLIGLFIAWTYQKTHKGISYSQSFVQTLVLLLPIGSLIFYFVSTNIATAIGLFGAFSLIRFRTAVKEPKDMLYIFWVLAMSLVVGSGQIATAIMATLIIAVVVYALYSINFGKMFAYEYILSYQLDTAKNDHAMIGKQLKELSSSQDIINVRNLKEGKVLEINLGVALKRDTSPNQVVELVLKQKGVKSANLISVKQHSEY